LKLIIRLSQEETKLLEAAAILRQERNLTRFAKKLLLQGTASVFDWHDDVENRQKLESLAERI